VEHTQQEHHHPTPVHQHWLSRRRLLIANGAFAIYATALAVDTGHADRTWAIWAAVGYGVTTLILWLTRHKNVPVIVPLLVALAQLGSWLSYNPYLPVMAVFGMPKALGANGLLADPRVWLTAVSIALIWAAFTIAAPHRHCEDCRGNVMLSTVFIAASPVIAFPLAVGITDPPVIALMFLTLALIARPSGLIRAAAALGVACAMKATAWPAVPVFTAMLAARDGARSAWRFLGATILMAGLLAALLAPAALADPYAFLQNTVLFPLGLTQHKTPAASPLPGHLLASTGMPGHWAAVGLLVAAGVSFATWLIVRPPTDARAAARRLALGLAVMFTLAPATRWGYFVYPIGLAGWLLLTRPGTDTDTAAGRAIEIPVPATEERHLPAGAR